MEKWIEILAGHGASGLILALVLFFIYRNAWPALINHLKRCEEDRVQAKLDMNNAHKEFAAERKEARREYTDSIRARDVMIAEVHEKSVETLTRLSGEFQALREDIKEKL